MDLEKWHAQDLKTISSLVIWSFDPKQRILMSSWDVFAPGCWRWNTRSLSSFESTRNTLVAFGHGIFLFIICIWYHCAYPGWIAQQDCEDDWSFHRRIGSEKGQKKRCGMSLYSIAHVLTYYDLFSLIFIFNVWSHFTDPRGRSSVGGVGGAK